MRRQFDSGIAETSHSLSGEHFDAHANTSDSLEKSSFVSSPIKLQTTLRERFEKLRYAGTVMLLVAHPDDERPELIEYLTRRGIRVICVSITRGEGGENELGATDSRDLGAIRSLEMNDARKYDGGEQYVTHGEDFNYTVSGKESIEKWGEETLEDIVWFLRNFQSDLILRFPLSTLGPDLTTKGDHHGHHYASAILGFRAFRLAREEDKFPHLGLPLLDDDARLFQLSYAHYASDTHPKNGYHILDIQNGKTLLGGKYSSVELGQGAFGAYISQGMGSYAVGRNEPAYLLALDGKTKKEENPFDLKRWRWDRIPGGHTIESALDEAIQVFETESPESSIPYLAALLEDIEDLAQKAPKNFSSILEHKKKEVIDLLLDCASFQTSVQAQSSYGTPGEKMDLNLEWSGQLSHLFQVEGIKVGDTKHVIEEEAKKFSFKIPDVVVPLQTPFSHPPYLEPESADKLKQDPNYRNTLLRAVSDSPFQATIYLRTKHGTQFSIQRPVTYGIDEAEKPISIGPAITIDSHSSVLFPNGSKRTLSLTVTKHVPEASGTMRLEVPKGWEVTEKQIPFHIAAAESSTEVQFTVKPLSGSNEPATIKVVTSIDGIESYARSLHTLKHVAVERPPLFPKCEIRAVPYHLEQDRSPRHHVAYISPNGGNSHMPSIFQQMHFPVRAFDPAAFRNAPLGDYDTFFFDTSVLNHDPDLITDGVLAQVEKGARMIVMPQKRDLGYIKDPSRLGAYPVMTSSAQRVRDPHAEPVDMEHPLLPYRHLQSLEAFSHWNRAGRTRLAIQLQPSDVYQPVLGFRVGGDPQAPPVIAIAAAQYGKGTSIICAIPVSQPNVVPGQLNILSGLITRQRTASL